jgi:protein tyrosine phosphatase (PTP) superfamily phosphohydrolase (DUF442 family)
MQRVIPLVMTFCALGVVAAAEETGIRNFLRINDQICTGGQPTAEEFERLKADGVRAILNLRRPAEKETPLASGERIPYDAAAEAAEAQRLGLRYFNIPVDRDAPRDEQVEAFLKVVADPENRPLFIHCSTANRVGGFWMIRRVLVDGWTVEAAEEEARRIGLSNEKTRAFARDYLERHQKKD